MCVLCWRRTAGDSRPRDYPPRVPDHDPRHVPVLLREVLALLAPGSGQVYVDATAGLGGHAFAVAPHLGTAGTILLNDLDPQNLGAAAQHVRALPSAPRVETIHGNFALLPHGLSQRGLRADMMLADLGFASSQVDDPARGLSFQHDGPLDMRLDPAGPLTAQQIVSTWPSEEIERIIREYGEDRLARLIARRIVGDREREPITSTSRLAAIVRRAYAAVGNRSEHVDPATRTFQALRIAVNDELGNLEALLALIEAAAAGHASAPTWLAPGARLVFITFHSLEDRPVKQAFARMEERGLAVDLTPAIVRPSDGEVRANPRARSAKVRAIRLAH